MQNDTPYNLLIWEDPTKLPFPKEVIPLIKDINWEDFEWHCMGLPFPYAKYCMSGGQQLYLSELPDGEIKVHKMAEYTGNFAMGGFFVNSKEDGEFNYFVQFDVTVCKGEVVEITVRSIHKQPAADYKVAMEEFHNNMKRVMRISNSWWFRWIYRPWYFVIRGIGFCLLTVMRYIKDFIIWVVNKLTPL